MRSYVIVGNGIASATAAELLRNEDVRAEITVIADDPFPIYYRPALKDYLRGKVSEDKLWVRPTTFYYDRRIRFLPDEVVGIQVRQHAVQLRSRKSIPYSHLLLAHGARARNLRCPGIDFVGVTTLRTIADYQRVLGRLNSVRHAVIAGSGTLALETVETLRRRGFQVTHLLRRRILWSEVLDPVASDLVLQQEKRDGIDIRVEQEIAEILGKDGQVTGVITTTGVHIPCEMVIVAVGIDPIIDFVKSAGIICGRGVKVDGMMRTNAPEIYAAGDLIETTDPMTGRTRLSGHWYPSIQQARAAAYSMLDLLDDKHQFHFGNFYNATFLYGLDFGSVGLTNIPEGGQGYQELVADPQAGAYQKVILKDHVPVGMLALGHRSSVFAFKRAIDHSVNLALVVSRLFDPDFKLGEWLDHQGVPAPILSVNGASARAVKNIAYADADTGPIMQTAPRSIETVLIPLAPPYLMPSLGETSLSQTSILTVGRQEGSDLIIPHASISRSHAQISYVNGHYLLRDLGSKNGTFVNDRRLEMGDVRILKPNDRIGFGKVTFVLHVREVSSSPPITVRQQGEAKRTESATALAGNGNSNIGIVAHRAALLELDVVNRTPSSVSSSLPTLNADGSLSIPGIERTIPAAMISRLKETPTLVAIVQGSPEVLALVPGRRFLLGRDLSSDIVLSDLSVSRQHAEVFPGSDGFYVRDLGSSNGVHVNRSKIDSPHRLSHGDHIAVGNIDMYFLELASRTTFPYMLSVTPQKGTIPFVDAKQVNGKPVEVSQSKPCRTCGMAENRLARFCTSCGAPL